MVSFISNIIKKVIKVNVVNKASCKMSCDASTAESLELGVRKVSQSGEKGLDVEERENEEEEKKKKRVANKLFPNSELFKKWGDDLSEDEQKQAQHLFQLYGYNVFLSDRLPLNRTLLDTRDIRYTVSDLLRSHIMLTFTFLLGSRGGYTLSLRVRHDTLTHYIAVRIYY